MNHAETHNINLLAGQRTVRVLQAEPENKTLVICHSTNVSQEKSNIPGTEERVQTSSFISLYLKSKGMKVKYSIWSRLKARTAASAKLAAQ